MADGTAAAGRAAPALPAVAHGTRDPAGPAAVRALLGLVRALRPGLRVGCYGELAAPSPEGAAAGPGGGRAIVVPLLPARLVLRRCDEARLRLESAARVRWPSPSPLVPSCADLPVPGTGRMLRPGKGGPCLTGDRPSRSTA
ncbi:MAG: hypothetical protein FWJ90_16430 [Actinomadura sp.]